MKIRTKPTVVIATGIISLLLLIVIATTELAQMNSPVVGAAGLVLNPVQRVGYALNDRIEQIIDFYFNFSGVRQKMKRSRRNWPVTKKKFGSLINFKKRTSNLRQCFNTKTDMPNTTTSGPM